LTDPFIKIRQLCKTFEKGKSPALDHIDAEFRSGQIVGLAGPDGAGKTTLMRILAGLLKPSSGSVEVCGFDTIKDQHHLHELLGYMPQKFGLYEELSVMQNLNLYADLQGISQKEKKAAYEQLLHFTGLSTFKDRLARNLSGGMKQKLGLACTLLRKPKLLLLDEPTVGVDPISRRELWKMIMELMNGEMLVIYSTAYLDEVEKCGEVLLLNEGKTLYVGSPAELTNRLNGQTFQIQGISGNRRQVLVKAQHDPEVIDAVVQGSSIRVVLKSPENHLQLDDGHLTAVPPRFEDAFLSILGGSHTAYSPLTQLTPQYPQEERPIIEAAGLTKRFGSFTAANQVTFSVKRGEIFGLLGPNGAGKSTTFKMLCGLLKPTEGTATVAGLSLQKAPSKARSQIGYMAQKFSLYGNMTVVQNLNFFSGIYPLFNDTDKNRVQEMIEVFFLHPYIHTTASELPLGFKQRLALACAVMHKPQVLFLDEPTSGVDPLTRREFWNHINAMVEKGVAIIVTTHFMDEAEYCDRIGLINQGRLICIGTPDELKSQARTPSLLHPTLEDAFIVLSTGNAHD